MLCGTRPYPAIRLMGLKYNNNSEMGLELGQYVKQLLKFMFQQKNSYDVEFLVTSEYFCNEQQTLKYA